MIDPDKLPKRCLLDTNIWIRALGQFKDERSADCKRFYEAMLEHEKEMLLAAPTLAELVRGHLGFEVPSTTSVRVVAFDRKAAQLLGDTFPASELKRLSGSTGLAYLKYDAMIAACALRWDALTLIAYDDDHVKLARTLPQLLIRTPADFEDIQKDFDDEHDGFARDGAARRSARKGRARVRS